MLSHTVKRLVAHKDKEKNKEKVKEFTDIRTKGIQTKTDENNHTGNQQDETGGFYKKTSQKAERKKNQGQPSGKKFLVCRFGIHKHAVKVKGSGNKRHGKSIGVWYDQIRCKSKEKKEQEPGYKSKGSAANPTCGKYHSGNGNIHAESVEQIQK